MLSSWGWPQPQEKDRKRYHSTAASGRHETIFTGNCGYAGRRNEMPRWSLNCCVASRSSVLRGTLRRKPSLVMYCNLSLDHENATAKKTVPSRRTNTYSGCACNASMDELPRAQEEDCGG